MAVESDEGFGLELREKVARALGVDTADLDVGLRSRAAIVQAQVPLVATDADTSGGSTLSPATSGASLCEHARACQLAARGQNATLHTIGFLHSYPSRSLSLRLEQAMQEGAAVEAPV